MATWFARTSRRLSLGHIQKVAPVPVAAASGTVADVYRRMEAEFGMLAPPVALHAPAPDVLAAVWMILRETLLAGDVADRAAKEAVAASVSLANRCPYCVEVHGAALVGVRDDDDAARIAAGRLDGVEDPWLRELARWAHDGGQRPSARGTAPVEPARAPMFIGVAVTFQYINRMVNIFLGESPLAPIPQGGRGVARVVAARVFGHFARAELRPGLARDLLPAAALPPDLAWAAGAPDIADALARGCTAIDGAAADVVPAAVRELLLARLADPHAAPPGFGVNRWLDEALCGLAPHERPAGRLALLAAWASYRVTDADVDGFRAGGGGDEAVVRLTAWASMAAARRIGTTLYHDAETVGI